MSRDKIVAVLAGVTLLVGGGIAYVASYEDSMPDLTGVNLKEADDYYTGIIFHEQDIISDRVVFADSNWKICRQSTPPGAKIGFMHTANVFVVKNDEECYTPKTTTTTTATKTKTTTPSTQKPVEGKVTVERDFDAECTPGLGGCVGLIVSANIACDITINIAFYDFDYNRVGSGWKYFPDMRAGEKAKVVIHSSYSGGGTWRLTDSSCVVR